MGKIIQEHIILWFPVTVGTPFPRSFIAWSYHGKFYKIDALTRFLARGFNFPLKLVGNIHGEELQKYLLENETKARVCGTIARHGNKFPG